MHPACKLEKRSAFVGIEHLIGREHKGRNMDVHGIHRLASFDVDYPIRNTPSWHASSKVANMKRADEPSQGIKLYDRSRVRTTLCMWERFVEEPKNTSRALSPPHTALERVSTQDGHPNHVVYL
jgi:hypothetical protein